MFEKDGSVSKCEDICFDCFWPEHASGFLVACVNGALVGKRQVATRNHSDTRSCMVSALSSICVLTSLLVVLWSGESVWVGVLSLVRRLERSVCTEVVVASVAPRISSAHDLARAVGWEIGIGLCGCAPCWWLMVSQWVGLSRGEGCVSLLLPRFGQETHG